MALINVFARLEQSENLTAKDVNNPWNADKIRTARHQLFAAEKKVSLNAKMFALDILADPMPIVFQPITRLLAFVDKVTKAMLLKKQSVAFAHRSVAKPSRNVHPTLSATVEFANQPASPAPNAKMERPASADSVSTPVCWMVPAV